MRALLVLVGWWLVLAGRPVELQRGHDRQATQLGAAKALVKLAGWPDLVGSYTGRRAGFTDARVVAAVPRAIELPAPPRATIVATALPTLPRCDAHARLRCARGPPIA